MATQSINEPFVSSTALRSVNFFNGRLLTGDDLSREQATHEARLRRLARAAGEGIAFGFEVQQQAALTSKAKPVVTVSAGLAVSRSGVALQLDKDIDVALYRDVAPAGPGTEPGNLFAACQPSAPGTYTAGAGVYVLVVGPAEEPEGRAPVNGLGNEDAICNVALEAEALAFRLIRLSVPHDALTAKKLLRNRVAYSCFGTAQLADVIEDPFGPALTSYGLLDTLRTETLSDDEVPLAAIGWSIDDGIQFVDLWSVRRRMTRRPAEGDWADLVSDRRRADGEAMFLQFQAQLDDLRQSTGTPEKLLASDTFELLPPLGVVPVGPPGAGAFDRTKFFAGVHARDPVYAEGAKVAALIRASFAYPPVDPHGKELVWLYVVRENTQASAPAHPYLIFANGQTPYVGDPRFDLAYWDFANYALTA